MEDCKTLLRERCQANAGQENPLLSCKKRGIIVRFSLRRCLQKPSRSTLLRLYDSEIYQAGRAHGQQRVTFFPNYLWMDKAMRILHSVIVAFWH